MPPPQPLGHDFSDFHWMFFVGEEIPVFWIRSGETRDGNGSSYAHFGILVSIQCFHSPHVFVVVLQIGGRAQERRGITEEDGRTPRGAGKGCCVITDVRVVPKRENSRGTQLSLFNARFVVMAQITYF